MSPTDALAAILLVLSALCMFGGRIVEAFFRSRANEKIHNKEEQLNEASKNSANALDEYRRLKRQYEDNGDK